LIELVDHVTLEEEVSRKSPEKIIKHHKSRKKKIKKKIKNTKRYFGENLANICIGNNKKTYKLKNVIKTSGENLANRCYL
jgi:hypothetical protein